MPVRFAISSSVESLPASRPKRAGNPRPGLARHVIMDAMRLPLFKRTSSPEYRLPFIEGIRGLAALYVVIGHICSMSDPRAFQGQTSHAPLWVQQAMAPFWNGHLAVAAFIVVSGFCLQMSLFPGKDGHIKRLGEYFKRRARRMLPAYYACLAASIAVCFTVTIHQKGMPFEQYLPVTQQNVLAHLFLVHNWSPEWMYKLNGVLWSIAIEAQLYIVFPILVFLAFRAGRFLTAAITGAIGFGIVYQWPETVKLYPWYLALFTFGLLSAHLAFRPSLKQGVMPRLAMWLSLALGVSCIGSIPYGLPLPLTDALGAASVAALLYSGITRPDHWFLKLIGCKPVAWLGLFSYTIRSSRSCLSIGRHGRPMKPVSSPTSSTASRSRWLPAGCSGGCSSDRS